MNIDFCPVCKNLYSLYDDITKKELYNKCDICCTQLKVNKTLIYSKKYRTNDNVDRINYDLLKYDYTLPKVDTFNCPKCKNIDIKYIRKQDLTLVYYCINCSHHWINKKSKCAEPS